ncbi:MAG: hypothetical protein GYA36_17435 [Veillonellaceae bacterium]|nr:hypothetical protein [Veillonellaceae bacterium]
MDQHNDNKKHDCIEERKVLASLIEDPQYSILVVGDHSLKCFHGTGKIAEKLVLCMLAALHTILD